MGNLIISETNLTPAVRFDSTSGIFEIKGKSLPEDARSFYNPLVGWISKYAENPKQSTSLNIILSFFNTTTSLCLIDIFKEINILRKIGNEVIINWYYEDEYIMEAGEDFQYILNIPITLIELKNKNSKSFSLFDNN